MPSKKRQQQRLDFGQAMVITCLPKFSVVERGGSGRPIVNCTEICETCPALGECLARNKESVMNGIMQAFEKGKKTCKANSETASAKRSQP